MYKCTCGAIFNESSQIQDVVGNYWGVPYSETSYTCPDCGTEDFEETSQCGECGSEVWLNELHTCIDGEERCDLCCIKCDSCYEYYSLYDEGIYNHRVRELYICNNCRRGED